MEPLTIVLVVIGVILLLVSLYLLRSGGDFETSINTRLNRAWRRLVFFGGTVRRLKHFPFVTWGREEPLVSIDEVFEAMKLVRPGDIGLHTEKWCLSNVAIPGFMKHAWIHINESDDVSKVKIIEAVAQGVVLRSAYYPIHCDYAIILRPKNVSREDINKACLKAEKIVGCKYDASFKFDIEEELAIFGEGEKGIEAAREREIQVANLGAEWDGGFSCTETVSFAWWHKRKELGIERKKARGKQVILGDSLINDNFEIVWMSKSVTPEIAKEYGLDVEAVCKIKEVLSKSK